MRKRLTVEDYLNGIRSHNRVILSQAITLIESKNAADTALAKELLIAITPFTGESLRIGITGVPGVGKSTFINVFGKHLTQSGHRIAVLSIDPSSQRTRGSILGDKTRMVDLASDPSAFIRPSPSGNALGGVANKTRETMLLCEAAGYDIVIVETVGVGQSETAVRNMVDFFLLLMLAGGGDELQGIKKGIMEMADAIVINKADGDFKKAARKAKNDYQNAIHMFPPARSNWTPQVTTCSSIESTGIKDIWKIICQYKSKTRENGFFEQNRIDQNVSWFHDLLKIRLLERLLSENEMMQSLVEEKIAAIKQNKLDPSSAVSEIIKKQVPV